MLSERPPMSTERPTRGKRLRSLRSPICSYVIPARTTTPSRRTKYFEANLSHSFSLGCTHASIPRVHLLRLETSREGQQTLPLQQYYLCSWGLTQKGHRVTRPGRPFPYLAALSGASIYIISNLESFPTC